MRKPRKSRAKRDDFDDDYDAAPRRSLWRRAFSAVMPSRLSDTAAVAVATAAALAVVVNAVAFQHSSRAGLDPINTKLGITATVPPPEPQRRPADAPVRGMTDLIQNIQRELSNRGYYNGAVDGVPGPRTEQAIRDFQKGRGQNTLEPSDALLLDIRRAPAKNDITGSINTPPADQRSLRVLALQRTLARLGYGPVRLTGTYGADTKVAIERFERDWMMPITGLMSDAVFAKVAAVNGAPID